MRGSPPALGASGSVNASVIFNILVSPQSTVLLYGAIFPVLENRTQVAHQTHCRHVSHLQLLRILAAAAALHSLHLHKVGIDLQASFQCPPSCLVDSGFTTTLLEPWYASAALLLQPTCFYNLDVQRHCLLLVIEGTVPDMQFAGRTAKSWSIRALHRVHSTSWRSSNWSSNILGLQEGTLALLDTLTLTAMIATVTWSPAVLKSLTPQEALLAASS